MINCGSLGNRIDPSRLLDDKFQCTGVLSFFLCCDFHYNAIVYG
jgi:hypothetical protein